MTTTTPGMPTAVSGAVRAGATLMAIALPAHYPWNLDTVGHLGLVYLAMAVFAAGAVLSGKGLLDPER